MDKTLMDMIERLEGRVDNIVKVLELADKIGEQEPDVEPEETVKILDENNKIRTELLPDLCKTNDITSRQYVKLDKAVGTYELTSGTITKEGKKATFEIKDSDTFTIQLLQTDKTLPVISIRSQDGETNYFNVDYQVDDEWTPFLNDGDKTVYYYNYATIDVAKIIIPEELHDAALQITFGNSYETISTLTHTDGLKIDGNLTVSNNILNNYLFDENQNIKNDIIPKITEKSIIKPHWIIKDKIGTYGTYGREADLIEDKHYYNEYVIISDQEIKITFRDKSTPTKITIFIHAYESVKTILLDYQFDSEWTPEYTSDDLTIYKNSATISIADLAMPEKLKVLVAQKKEIKIWADYNYLTVANSGGSKALATIEYEDNNIDANAIITYGSMREINYPIGAIYMSINNNNPQGFIGGTWESITSPIEGSYAWKRTA